MVVKINLSPFPTGVVLSFVVAVNQLDRDQSPARPFVKI